MNDIVLDKQDSTWLSWSLTRISSGTVSTFLKSLFRRRRPKRLLEAVQLRRKFWRRQV